MAFSALIAWLLLALSAVVSAQTRTAAPSSSEDSSSISSSTAMTTTTSSPSSASSSSTAVATHTVKVGSSQDPHQYLPSNITAAVGDVIIFEFYPRNHSVVKADYMAPCVPAAKDVFYSGEFNRFNENNGQLVGPPPTWSLVVNDTKPTFFYCTAIDSCIGNGMVGVINPNATMTFDAQYKKAKEYPYMLVPGQSAPAEGSNPPTSTGDGYGYPSSSSTAAASSGGVHLSNGAIAGIVVGSVAFVAILVALFFVLGRNRIYKKWMSSEDGRTERTARWALFNSNGEPWARKSELASNSAHPAEQQSMYVSSPDPTHRAFSPPPPPASGHWSWDAQSFQQQQHASQLPSRGPTELEAIEPMGQIPEMRSTGDTGPTGPR